MTSLIFWPKERIKQRLGGYSIGVQPVLTTGKTGDFIVLGDVPIQTYVLKMFSNDLGGGVPLSGTFSRRLQVIKL